MVAGVIRATLPLKGEVSSRCPLTRREAGPQHHSQKLASNCSENSEIGFLLCCVADPHVSRQLEKLNSCNQPGLYWTSAGQVFGLGCGALNITLPSCVWRWNELVNECLSICSASGRCFAKVQVPWGGLATWSSFHDILTKGTPTFRFTAEDGRMLDYCLAKCTGFLGGLWVWCIFVI